MKEKTLSLLISKKQLINQTSQHVMSEPVMVMLFGTPLPKMPSLKKTVEEILKTTLPVQTIPSLPKKDKEEELKSAIDSLMVDHD